MTDYHNTLGARQDRQKTWKLMERMADALERIADALDAEAEDRRAGARLTFEVQMQEEEE